jgi:hypothetical protein
MTVGELIAKDAEGNSYSPLYSYWTGRYAPENTYSGEAGLERLTRADRKAGFTQADVLDDGVPALILTPTN